MKITMTPFLFPEDLTIEDSSQATPNVIDPAPTTEETISEPSNMKLCRTN